jgi:hypothetical protein
VDEATPTTGFANDYVRSKRLCENLVLRSGIDSVILRPSIVLSQGLRSRHFARSILWVFPVIKALGALPMSGNKQIDVVTVGFVAKAVSAILQRRIDHRIYHVSAGKEASVGWRALFSSLTDAGYEYGHVRFHEPDWQAFGRSQRRLLRLKSMLDHYLPFMGSGVIYDNSRLRRCLLEDFPMCAKATEYCPELLSQFTEREAFDEASKP